MVAREQVERFSFPDLQGEMVSSCRPVEPEKEIRRLIDPSSALKTLHWGRNYIYTAALTTAAEPLEPVVAVVKQFRTHGLAARLRRRLRGSKAARSWYMAWAFKEAGLPTAEPLMLVESRRTDGPSFFITRSLGEVVEARYLLRAANEGRLDQDFPEFDYGGFLLELGRLLRRMHDARLWHRDLSIGNVLLRFSPDGRESSGRTPELFIIDLNRARAGRTLTLSERLRDLCRLSLFRSEDQELFLRAYWGPEAKHFEWRRRLYHLYQRGFLGRIETKKKIRGGFRGLRNWLRPRSTHAHIPQAPEGASARDKIVWDRLSDQPHQHATRLEKLQVRLADAGDHARSALAVASAAPRVWRRYRQLKARLYDQPCSFDGMGVCLRPWSEDPEGLLAAVEDLGAKQILLRLHPWQDDHRAEEVLARELHSRGYELAFSLPQNRELVKDTARWRATLEELAERFLPYGRHFQVGQAINRSKWGVWSYREYLRLAEVACEVFRSPCRRAQGTPVELLGPSVIDFEYHATVAALNLPHPGVHFDAVSALLYVDRRGAPENRQTGLDTVDKVVLLRAVAETARHSAGRCWITEFNWPLWEGPHSPAGRDVSVDEESQANYLVRYYLLALGTGLVERVYWWQIIAKGYGLIDPPVGSGEPLRRRPSFRALATLLARLRGAIFLGPQQNVPDAWLYLFQQPSGEEVAVGWSLDRPRKISLPRPAFAVTSRDGEALPPPPGRDVEVSATPRYFHLER